MNKVIIIDMDKFIASTQLEVSDVLTALHNYIKSHEYTAHVIVHDNEREEAIVEEWGSDEFFMYFVGKAFSMPEFVATHEEPFRIVVTEDQDIFQGATMSPAEFYKHVASNEPLP